METKFNYQIVFNCVSSDERAIFTGVTSRDIEVEIQSRKSFLPKEKDFILESVVYQPINSINNESQEKK